MVHSYHGLLLGNKKEQITDTWNMGESQRHDVEEAREWFYMLPLCDILEQAKLISSEIKQISGCWRWRITADRQAQGDFFLGWKECFLSWLDWSHRCLQTIHLKWVHFIYVTSSSKKLIYKGEKAGHKHFFKLTLMLKEFIKAN